MNLKAPLRQWALRMQAAGFVLALAGLFVERTHSAEADMAAIGFFFFLSPAFVLLMVGTLLGAVDRLRATEVVPKDDGTRVAPRAGSAILLGGLLLLFAVGARIGLELLRGLTGGVR